MFIERNICNPEARSGWIEVIAGCMFSGKTEELIRRLKRSSIAKQKVAIFKPAIDKRYDVMKVVSHDKHAIDSVPVIRAEEILKRSVDVDVIGIDEAQFFNDKIVDVANDLANAGKRVIIAGLDMDYTGRPFGPMPQLLAIAEFVTKVNAICSKTGEIASYTYRFESKSDEQVFVGEKEAYTALSRRAFFENMKSRGVYRTSSRKPVKHKTR
ncbi:MAG: thymidine kinase [Patescibacteria group bacterium]|nr:thymidine kinase [Patescibacteria group bacterium]MDE2116346.1 thymidine kinase [Patescibacteria group bacterium]